MSLPDKREHFLCILPERLGDIIFCTPALALLRSLRPHSYIDIICATPMASAILAHNPAINDIHICKPNSNIINTLPAYDQLFCLHCNKTTRAFALKFNAPCHFAKPTDERPHQSQVATDVIATALPGHNQIEDAPYRLYPSKDDKQHVALLLQQYGIDIADKPILIGCQIGCSKTVKNGRKFWKPGNKMLLAKSWEIERFANLIHAIHAFDDTIAIVLTGTDAERRLLKPLFKLPNVIDFVGKTTVLQTTALMHYLTAFVSIDTGPLHIACATDVPIVALFGGTLAKHTGPFPLRDNITVIERESMQAIDVDTVMQAIGTILNEQNQQVA